MESENFLSNFYNYSYTIHNIARISHLESLNLIENNKKVIEFGAGIGDHTLYYLFKNLSILPTDGRIELVEFISKRFGIESIVFNPVLDLNTIKSKGYFDIGHCYGFLYHISNPEEFIKLSKDLCETLIIETCVSSDHLPDDIYLTTENLNNFSQAIDGIGCRPTRNWIFNCLKANFKFVYCPATQPKHYEFPMDWNFEFSNDTLQRAIFIASQKSIDNPLLLNFIPKNYSKW